MAASKRFEDSGGRPPRAAGAGKVLLPATAALLLAACGSGAAGPVVQPASSRPAAPSTPSGSPSLPVAGRLTTVAASLGSLTDQNDTYGIAADGTSIWLYNGETGTLKRVAATGEVTATVQLRPGCNTGRGCGNLAVGDGAVWVANDLDGTITRVDAASGRVAATIQVDPGAAPQVYTTPGAVWSANYLRDSYTRIDPATNRIVGTLQHHLSAEAVALAGGSVWLCDAGGEPALTRLDATTFAVQKQIDLSVGGSQDFCLDAVPLGSSLYVVTDGHGPLVVDLATGQATPVTAPGDTYVERGLVGSAGGTWGIEGRLGVFRFDPASGRPAAEVSLSGLVGIASDGHAIWTISSAGTLYRIDPA
jgi:glutamine cyclotransferase